MGTLLLSPLSLETQREFREAFPIWAEEAVGGGFVVEVDASMQFDTSVGNDLSSLIKSYIQL